MDCGCFTDITMKGGLCVIYTSLLTISVLSSCALFILVVSEALQAEGGVDTNVDLSGLHNVSQKVVGEQDVPGPQVPPDAQFPEDPNTDEDHEMIFAETLSLNSVTTEGNSKHSTTDRSPAEVLFGHKLRCRLDLLTPTTTTPSDAALDTAVKVKQCSQIDNYRGSRKVSFSVGDQVLVKLYNQQKHYWSRGKIIKHIGKTMFLVQLCESDQTVKRHANQLLKFRGKEDRSCEEIVPAFVMPSQSTSSEQLPPEVADEELPVESGMPASELHQSDQSAEREQIPAPSVELEPDTRSKRHRTVVDYTKFF